MSNPNNNEKIEIIEQALLQSVGGGTLDTSRIPRPGDCHIDISAIACTLECRTKEK